VFLGLALDPNVVAKMIGVGLATRIAIAKDIDIDDGATRPGASDDDVAGQEETSTPLLARLGLPNLDLHYGSTTAPTPSVPAQSRAGGHRTGPRNDLSPRHARRPRTKVAHGGPVSAGRE
jgi:hypothetical protein